MFSVCGAPLDDWAIGGYINVLFMRGVVLVLSGVGPVLRSRSGIE